MLKRLSVPVRIEINDLGLDFSFRKYEEYFDAFHLRYDEIVSVKKRNPFGFPNKLIIEYNDGKRYSVATYKRNKMYKVIARKIEKRPAKAQHEAWIKIFHFPFFYELYTSGTIRLEKHALRFDPFNNGGVYKSIEIPYESIEKAVRRNYMIFIPQLIVVKTADGKKYKFAVKNRNQIHRQITERLDE